MFAIDATLIVVFFSFLVFMGLMNNIFFRPMLDLKQEREDSIATGNRTMAEAASKRLSVSSEYEARIKSARLNALHIVQTKRAEAKAKASELVGNARENASEMVESRLMQLHSARETIYDQLKDDRDQLARDIVAKVSANTLGRETAGANH